MAKINPVVGSLLAVLLFGSAFGLALVSVVRQVPDENNTFGSTVVPIIYNRDIKFRVPVQNNRAYLLFVRLKNAQLINTDPFFLRIVSDKNETRQISLSGRNIGDDDWVKFQFNPIEDSAGQTLTITLTSVSVSEKNAIGVFTDANGQPLYRLYVRGNFLRQTLLSVEDFAKRFLGDRLFAVFYFLTVFSAFWLLIRTRGGKSPNP